nr:MAG TPA: hypothetical protein [Inoviridae sp.]
MVVGNSRKLKGILAESQARMPRIVLFLRKNDN